MKQSEPKSDLWDSYDFSDAVSGLGKLEVVTPISQGAEIDNSDDDLMLSFRVKRRRVSFDRTNKRVVKDINKTIAAYSDDYWELELELGLPVQTIQKWISERKYQCQQPMNRDTYQRTRM